MKTKIMKSKPPIIEHKINMQFSLIDAILFKLKQISVAESVDINEKKFIEEATTVYNFISKYISMINFNKRTDGQGIGYNNDIQVAFAYNYKNVTQENFKEIENLAFHYLDSEPMYLIFEELGKATNIYKVVEKLHKQPRNLLKTVGQNISNTTEAPGLFTLPQRVESGGGAIGELKEEISKNTGALAFYLIQKYQENSSKPLEITNLNSIAEAMSFTNYRLKLYLLYLGGYVYPIIDKDEKTKELVLTNEQLFKIEFRYSQKIADKYSVKEGEIQGVERIGNNVVNFIKDEPLDRVIITPSQRFINALEGKGLGNILTVNNKFVGLILELTDIATKIFCYSSSNRPTWKIAEDNLIKHLGLTKQIKKQGKPRVRATILKGLQELQDKGHIKSYSFDQPTEMYSYTYSDKYVKYKEAKKNKIDSPEGVH